jgi:iron complex transport system ATP-binding protein
LIDINGLGFSYNGRNVLKDVKLHIKKGEFFGIVGPNGAGKSTLIKCICRTLDIPARKVSVDGKDITKMKRKDIARILAVVPQEVIYGFDFTVNEVVSMGRYPHLGRFEFESPKHKKIVEEAMIYTEILEFKDKTITALSGGERQRVIIAQAFAQKPKILLLDEPTKNLDIRHTMDIMNLIRKWNRRRKLTVVSVFHDLNLAARYCDRIALLKDGRIIEVGRKANVLNTRNIERVFGVNVQVEEGDIPYIRIFDASGKF